MVDKLNADHLAEAQGSFEPQRTANWLLEVHGLPGGDDLNLIELSLESFAAPRTSNDEIELGYLNERRYVAGKALFETQDLVVKDFVDRQTAGAILRWRRQVYDPSTGKIGLAAYYKKDCNIILFAPDGSQERLWRLQGWPKAANYGDLNQVQSEKVLITCTLRYDKALPVSGFGDQVLEVPIS